MMYDYWEDLWALAREQLVRSQYSKMPMRQELLGLVSFLFRFQPGGALLGSKEKQGDDF